MKKLFVIKHDESCRERVVVAETQKKAFDIILETTDIDHYQNGLYLNYDYTRDKLEWIIFSRDWA